MQFHHFLLILIFSSLLYFFMIAYLLPLLFLRRKPPANIPHDRVIRRFRGDDFFGVEYFPRPAFRRWIRAYVIEEKDGEKFLRCKLAEDLRYLEMDVAVFSPDKHLVEVLHVKEVVTESGYTQKISLPDETAFVCLHLIETDRGRLQSAPRYKIAPANVFLFVLFQMIATASMVLAVKFCCANLFGGLFRESFMLENTYPITIAIVFALTVLSALSMIPYIRGDRT